MPRAVQSPYDTIKLICKHADAGLSSPRKAATELEEIRRLAQRLQGEIDREVRLAERRGTEPRGRPKQPTRIVGYSIEHGRYEIAITEHRSSAAAPFRCPRSMYDLVAEVLDDTTEPVRFNDVYDEAERRFESEIPDYQVRVAMRFFTHVGAVKHSRARFTKDSKKSFRRIAKEAWDDLQRRTAAGQVPA